MSDWFRSIGVRWAVWAGCALAWAAGFAQEALPGGRERLADVAPPPGPVEAIQALPLSPLRVSYEHGVLFLGWASAGGGREAAIEYSVDLRGWVGVEVGWGEGGPPPPPPIEWVESLARAPGEGVRMVPVDGSGSGLGFYRTVWRPGGESAAAGASPILGVRSR